MLPPTDVSDDMWNAYKYFLTELYRRYNKIEE